MKAKKILTTVMAITFVTVLGLAAYAMGPGDKAETENTPVAMQHHSDTGGCGYMMSSHTAQMNAHMGSQMAQTDSQLCPQADSHMDSTRTMGNQMDADNTCMMSRHLGSGAQMMNHDHSAESSAGLNSTR